jgi:acetoin utilization protein AcuB
MLVKNWMTEKVITVEPETSMQYAIKLMRQHHIRILPVMSANKIVGVVTDQDIKRASASDATSLEVHELVYLLSELKLKLIMNKAPVVVWFDYTIDEAAEKMARNKVSGAPVIDHKGKLVGVITQTDISKALISLTGADQKGIQFAFLIEDRPGSIKNLTDIIRDNDGRLLSILSSYDRAPAKHRYLYVRAFGLDRKILSELKEKLSIEGKILYMIDHRENKREIYH